MPRTEYSELEVIESSPTSLFTRVSVSDSTSAPAPAVHVPSRNLEAHSNVLVNWRSAVPAAAHHASAHPTLQPVSEPNLPSELSSTNGIASEAVAIGVSSDVTEAGANNLRNAAEQIWKRCMETL